MSHTFIILAAGSGTRLLPLTQDRPKCMVALKGRPLLEWQIAAAREAGATKIIVVAGYKEVSVRADGIVKVLNPRYASTNMVESLWCAEKYFGDGVTVSYGDIAYEPGVLADLTACPAPSAVIVDADWKAYWTMRFSDILADAESLRLDESQRITHIGQKETSVDAIQAQYIGLFKLGGKALAAAAQIRRQGKPLEPSLPGWTAPPRALEKWYMTDLLHAIVHSGVPLQGVVTYGRWVEIDSIQDLKVAEELTVEIGGRLRIRS